MHSTAAAAFAMLDAVRVGTPDPEIVALEAALRTAQLAADVAALDALVGEPLLFTGPGGRLTSKAEDLAAHATGSVCLRAHVPRDLRVRRIGATVAVTALLTDLVVDVAGTRVAGSYRYTRVWAREHAGAWQVVGGHVSAVPTAAPSPSLQAGDA